MTFLGVDGFSMHRGLHGRFLGIPFPLPDVSARGLSSFFQKLIEIPQSRILTCKNQGE